MLGRLRAVGIAEVVTLDLTGPEVGVPVVRVVIPGLEGPDDHDAYVPGPRARRFVGRTAMKACVFVGPTLRPQDLPPDDDIVALPPVAQGDVYRIAQRRPQAIGIIDGYFEGVLAVWHKEILWAMAEGIHVFGSASMGALRAAELHPFGMVGVGRIFEAYRDGELEDDDEVAVIHGPPETGYLALSEAMVNIRRTLSEAERAGVIARVEPGCPGPPRQGAVLSRPYLRAASGSRRRVAPSGGDRRAARLAAAGSGRPEARRCARHARRRCKALLASGPEPMRVDYTLEWTEVWDDATAAAAASPVVGPARSPRLGLPMSACSRSCASSPTPTPPYAIGRCCGSWQAREARAPPAHGR